MARRLHDWLVPKLHDLYYPAALCQILGVALDDQMTKGELTKQRILQTAAELVQAQGYHATGLNQIIEASETPRGSLYFHFPGGKEEIVATAAVEAGAQWRAELSEMIAAASSGEEALGIVVDELAQRLVDSGWRMGNPVATLALEMSPYSDLIQEVCSQSYREWQDLIVEIMKRFDLGSPELRSDMAMFVLSTIEGALVVARTHRSTRPLRVAKQALVVLNGAFSG